MALWLLLVVFGVSALAYFVAPAASLRVVGIASDPTERFLLRTLAAALLAFVVPLWLAAMRPSTSLRYGIVWGVITYLVASSLVDLAAYMGGIASGLSIPSAAVRSGQGALAEQELLQGRPVPALVRLKPLVEGSNPKELGIMRLLPHLA